MYQQAYGEVGYKTPGFIMNTLLLLSPFSYYLMFNIKNSDSTTYIGIRVYYITRDTLAFYGLFKIIGIVLWGTVFLILSSIFVYVHFKNVSK